LAVNWLKLQLLFITCAEKRLASKVLGMHVKHMCCLAVALVLATGAMAQKSAEQTKTTSDLPLAPGARVVTVTRPGFQNETSIAVNPSNPQQLVAAYQVNATAAFSRDGGLNWQIVPSTAPKDYKVSGDPSVAFDNKRRAYLCFIAFDKLGTENYWGHNATRNGIFVLRSDDGGQTWADHAIPVVAHATQPGIPFEDKPYIVADTTGSHFAGNLYVGWTQFDLVKSVMLFSRSTNGGQIWSQPIRISTHNGLPRDDNGSVEGFTGAVAPDGTLYVVWADGDHIAFTSSRDGGRTFAPSRFVVETAPPYFDIADVPRANGFPQIAFDTRSKSIIVTWSDYRNGDVDVFSSTSRDRGKHWSPAVRVNSDEVHNGKDQFFQWLATDPKTGDAYVIFYDRRNAPENRKTVVVLARSTDAGRTWTNYAWTEQPFVAHEDFLGDYTGIAAYDGRVYGSWSEEVERQARPIPGGTEPPPPKSGEQQQPRFNREEVTTKGHHTVVRVGVADFSSRKSAE
jgi:hypothetical protein